jgi:HEAT repeat protein
MLHAMLADQTDMLGRLLAVEQLSGRREALDKLKHALNTDPFYGVRIAASKSIRALASDEALEALLASTRQPDARVRQQVLADIGSTYREAAFAALVRLLPEERHPDLQAQILRALGAWHKPEVRDLVLRHLRSESFRQVLAEAAMNAMRAQDDPVYLAPLHEELQKRESVFPTGVQARGLENLAWLARNETNKDTVRESLTARVSHPRPAVRRAAVSALGTLGDPKAIAVLEKLTEGPPESSERGPAERALVKLRDARQPSVELGSLRSDVLTLQRENRDLRRDLDELRKRFDALTAKPAPAMPAPTTKPAPRLRPPKG